MRLGLLGYGLIPPLLMLSIGCSRASIPFGSAGTPTPLPTQVTLPTLAPLALPTPTLNLIPPGDSSETAQMLRDFIEAVSKGEIDGALTYWDTSQPGQPEGYAANVRKMVQDWIDKKRQLVIGAITYLGLDQTGKYVPMPQTDPRVERANAQIRIDGVEYVFYLIELKGGWFISGVNTVK